MSTDPSLYLAIDQGGHATRAIAFEPQGVAIAEHSAPISTSRPAPDMVEHDPDELAGSVALAAAGLAEKLGRRVHDVVAGGFATQRSSVGFWDRETGEALAPIASWQDRRDAAHLEPIERTRRAEIARITGLRVSPHYGANKLRWFLAHNERVRAAAEHGTLCCGPLASYLLARSLQEQPLCADPANASRTLLWDLHSKAWSERLLDLFGIPKGVLPSSVPSRYDYGTIVLGDHTIPVTVCTGDQSAAVFASGALDLHAAYVNIGTGAFIQKPTTASHEDAAPLLQSVVWDDGHTSYRVLEGTINGAASAMEEWIAPEDPQWAEHLDGLLTEINDPPLFLNGVSGLAAPYWVPDFPTRFVGAERAGVGERAVAVLESVVFLLQENLIALADKQEPVERIVMTGGLANSDAVCARVAALSGCRVLRPRYSEATARGLCYLLRPDGADEGAWRAALGPPLEFLPQPDPALEARYRRWREELQRLLPG